MNLNYDNLIESIMDKLEDRYNEREGICNKLRMPLTYEYNHGYLDAKCDIENILYEVLEGTSEEENNGFNVVTW